jgi:hypothetical protein
MNLFQQIKERKILDKDGKVDALGPYGKSKLTGQEVANYFKKNKVKDPKIKKAVEVALDLSGAMDVAGKEIQKFFGRKIRNSKEVKHALKYANESFEMNQLVGMLHEDVLNLTEKNLMPDIQKIVDTKGAAKVGGVMLDMFTASMISKVYDKVNDGNKKKMEKAKIEVLVKLAHKVMGMKEEQVAEIIEGKNLKQLKKIYKRDVKNYNNNRDISQGAAMAFAYWAIKNGEIKTDDPDEFDQWLDDNLSEWISADGTRRRVSEKDQRKVTEKKDPMDIPHKAQDIAKKMMKSRTMKGFASKVKKMKKVTHNDLEKMLPDYISGGDINALFNEESISEGGKSNAQKAAIAISKKEKAGKPGYDKEGKSLKKETVMNSYRQMWEDAVEEETIVEKKEFNPKAVEKIAKMTDKNDHNASVLLLAREMREKKVEKMMNLLIQMHKENGSMTSDMVAVRKGMYDDLLKKAKKDYSNYDDIYGAF